MDHDDPYSEQDDSELLNRSREGDRRAFSELWRRHAPGAVRYARSLGPPPPDPEDVVGEAFTRIMRLLWEGRGPQGQLRPYLFTTIKNIRYGILGKMPPAAPIHEVEQLPSTIGTVDEFQMADSAAIASAFRSLPERWQQALWLSEVEQMPPRQIAEVLGLKPNSVAALTYRAREALRKAWIQAQLLRAPQGTTHEEIIELLGSYVRDSLPDRARTNVEAHLETCEFCRAAAAEARYLSRALALAPFLVGGASLVIAPMLIPAEGAAASVTDPEAIAGHPGTDAVAGPGGRDGAAWWWMPIAASVLLLLVIGGVLLTSLQHGPNVADPHDSRPRVAATSPPSTTTPAPAPVPVPTVSSPLPISPTRSIVQIGPEGGGSVDPRPPVSAAVGAPSDVRADTGSGVLSGLLQPILRGRAEPNSTVVITVGDERVEAPVSAEGTWTAPPLNALPSGTNTVSLVTETPRGVSDVVATSVTTGAPVAEVSFEGDQITMSVSGVPDATVLLIADDQVPWANVRLGPTGTWAGRAEWFPPPGEHTIATRYVDAGGRMGPLIIQRVVAGG